MHQYAEVGPLIRILIPYLQVFQVDDTDETVEGYLTTARLGRLLLMSPWLLLYVASPHRYALLLLFDKLTLEGV